MLDKENTLFKNFSILMTANIVVRFFSAFTNILLARLLPQNAYGQLTYSVSLALLITFTLTFGLPDYLVREISKEPKSAPSLLGQSFWLFLLLALSNLILLLLFCFSSNIKSETIWIILIISGGSGVVVSFSKILAAVFRALNRVDYQAFTSIVDAALMMIILLPIAWISGNVVALAWAYLAITCFTLFANFILIKKLIQLEFRLVKYPFQLLRKTAPFGLIIIFPALFDKVISSCILVIHGETLVGGFNAAYVVFSAVLMIALTLDQIFYPILAKQSVGCQISLVRTFRDYLRISTILGIPISLVLFSFADLISDLLFPADYVGVGIVLKPLACSVVPVFWSFVLLGLLRAVGKQNRVVLLQFIPFLLLLISVYPVTLFSGLEGASWLLTAIEAASFLFLLSYAYILEFKGFSFFRNLASPLFSGTVMGISLFLLKDQPFFVVISISGSIYLVSILASGGVKKQELKSVLEFIQNR